jgi:hypothetical protein
MFRDSLNSVIQGFVFRKIVPGVLIGLLAVHLDPAGGGNDAATFVLSMVTFWAAIGVGHGVAELVFKSES